LDHRGVLYSWSHRGHINTSPPNRPLPHRAFKLKEVIEYNKAILADYQENHLEGPNAFPKWDKAIVVTPTPPENCMADTNVAAILTMWEHQPIWLITAYFPNDLENTKATVKALSK
jgi:hypothetical protein